MHFLIIFFTGWLHQIFLFQIYNLLLFSHPVMSNSAPMDCSTTGLPVHYLLELVQTHTHRVSDVIQPSCPLSSPFSLAFNPSQHQRFFQWVDSTHQLVKLLELQNQFFQWLYRVYSLYYWVVWSPFSSSDSQKSSSTPQLETSILHCSAVFMVQLSHPYMTTEKTIAWTIWIFFCIVMSLLFNILSRFVIAFLPSSKDSFNFMAAVTICGDFGAPQIKVYYCFHCFPIYLPWSEWSRATANRVLPREHTSHSKHPLPTTKKKTLHMDITRWPTPKSDWLYSLQPKMEKLYTVNKNKTRSWLWLRS